MSERREPVVTEDMCFAAFQVAPNGVAGPDVRPMLEAALSAAPHVEAGEDAWEITTERTMDEGLVRCIDDTIKMLPIGAGLRKSWDALRDSLPRWKPIDTAPMDGREILLWRADRGVFTGMFAHPSDLGDTPEYGGDEPTWWTSYGEDLSPDVPTHWMPLPSPPTGRERSEG